MLNVLAHELQILEKNQLSPQDIFKAVREVFKRCKGAYAAVALISGHGLLCFRDPYGIRPAVYGKRETENGTEFMVASESVALDALGYELIDDIGPGHAVFISEDGQLHTEKCIDEDTFAPCIFEHVYLARPDSLIDNVSVYKARLRMGEKLAEKILRDWSDHDIDVVIPIPDTSTTSAMQLANELNLKMRHGFIKNRYIGRTFIMPGQQMRKKSVRQKLNAIDLEFRGKNVLLVDDSIVRGTTSEQIIEMAREAGAKKVYFASAAPPVRYPNVYGIDMPAAEELIAHNRTEDEIGDIIGADKIIYQDVDAMVEAVQEGNPEIKQFDLSVFTGEYVTGDIDMNYLQELEQRRNDMAKSSQESSEIENSAMVMDLHNQ